MVCMRLKGGKMLLSRFFSIILFVMLLLSSLSINSFSVGVKKTGLYREYSDTWSKTYGKLFLSEMGFSVDTTSDGGYIVVGTAYYSRNGGVWLMKLDSYGNVEWKKIFGGYGVTGMGVKATSDGGYVVATDGMSVIKTDDRGNIEWTYIPSRDCWTWGDRVIQETSDGGFVIVGTLEYEDSSNCDVYLIRLNSMGVEVWNKTFGGGHRDFGDSIYPTSDGGFIITGGTYSFSPSEMSLWIIKTDSNGNEIWNKTFGDDSSTRGFSIQQTSGDGGYIITGEKSYREGGWVIKTDEYGNMIWNITIKECEVIYSVDQTNDGGYILGSVSGAPFIVEGDLYLIKVDSNGKIKWIKHYGRKNYFEGGYCVRATSDDGFIVVGFREEAIKWYPPLIDIWVLKTDENGYCTSYSIPNLIWEKLFLH